MSMRKLEFKKVSGVDGYPDQVELVEVAPGTSPLVFVFKTVDEMSQSTIVGMQKCLKKRLPDRSITVIAMTPKDTLEIYEEAP